MLEYNRRLSPKSNAGGMNAELTLPAFPRTLAAKHG
jgi:hypothetical protein